MYPVLFTIGDFKIYSSIFFLVLAILIGVTVGRIEARRVGVSGRGFFAYLLSVLPIALGLAVLNGLIFEIALWNILSNYEFEGAGGLVSFGAVMGVLAWGYVLARVTRKSPAEQLDLISVILPLILGIYRIGCLLNGCCYGMEIEGSLATPLVGMMGVTAPRYPTQIMLMLFNFALFAWLWMRRKKKRFQGEITLSFLLLYSLGRLIIDAFRDLPRVLGPLSLHQLSAIAVLLITICISYCMWKLRRGARRSHDIP